MDCNLTSLACKATPASPLVLPPSSLQLVANSEQILGSKYSRRLITMEKARAYDALAAELHYAALGPPR